METLVFSSHKVRIFQLLTCRGDRFLSANEAESSNWSGLAGWEKNILSASMSTSLDGRLPFNRLEEYIVG